MLDGRSTSPFAFACVQNFIGRYHNLASKEASEYTSKPNLEDLKVEVDIGASLKVPVTIYPC
jgi:hypothetical protein